MNPAVDAVFAEWRLPLGLTLSLVLTGIIYVLGWVQIRKTRPKQFTMLQLASFLAGLCVLWLAVGSPMDGFADALLSAHMVEHLLLMSVVPPLLLMGLPVVPLLRGLPFGLRTVIAAPLLRVCFLRRLGGWLTTPVVAWLLMNCSLLVWHIPFLYCYALQHEGWHAVEHICFLGTSMLFWFCILAPWPATTARLNWGMLIYLVSADVVNTILSGFLSFCGTPIYRYYIDRPNRFGLSSLDDQVLGAVVMWVIGSIAFLVPAMWITFRLLRPAGLARESASSASFRMRL